MADKGSLKQKAGQTVADVMTPDPICLVSTETLLNAAQAMRDGDVGAVIVLDDTTARVAGIVTDRDIAIRGVAEGADPSSTTLSTVCSENLVTITPEDTVERAVELMRQKAIRRLPVVEDGNAVGIVALGDLAVERDPKSALADISAAPANQ